MSEGYNEVFNILSDIEKINKEQYEELVSIYGVSVIGSVIEKLVKENEENIYRFDVYFSNMVDELNFCDDNYRLYLNDISLLPCMDEDSNLKLILQLTEIIKKLENIFMLFDFAQIKNNKFLWIEDKVNYCLEKCNDSIVLLDLERLFVEYNYIRGKIIEGNLRLVIKIASEYRADGLINSLDIIQYGNIGLMRALEKFDVTRGIAFSTYAVYWIKEEIRRNIRNIKYSTWIPEHLVNENRSLSRIESDLSINFGRRANDEEISLVSGKSVDKIKQIRNLFLRPISLDENIAIIDDFADYSLLDLIGDESADVYEIVYNDFVCVKLKEILEEILTERQRAVLMYLYGFYGDKYSETDVAAIIGVSRARINQIKNDAIKKLKRISNIRSMWYD